MESFSCVWALAVIDADRAAMMEVIWSRTSLKHFPDAIVIGVIVHQKQSPKTVNEVLKHFFAVKV